MASTEQKAGFRLPWGGSASTDAPEAETQPEDGSPQVDQEGAQMSIATADPTQAPADGGQAEQVAPAEEHPAAAAAAPMAAPVVPHKAGARFVTELVRAMRAELEKHRDSTLDEFRVEAKNHVEGVHKRSAEEVTELRQIADEDIAGVREWSKAEIARIRAETEERIETRKGELESHLEEHAALIEREIEKVQARVTAYEAEIDAFFASLAQIEDPAAFASAAQQVPDPPSLEAAGAEARSEALADLIRAGNAQEEANPEQRAEAEAPVAEASAVEMVDAQAATEEPSAAATVGESAPMDPQDPRTAALAASEDLAAAESQAAVDAATSVSEESEEIPESEADIVAARLSGLVPEHVGAIQRAAPPDDMVSTQVIVTGLVSVASIASFKRHLSRLTGVNSVGVSSGPDGEFIFKANHAPGTNLKDLLPTISGYSVRVTSAGDGVINVSARDPEN